MKENAVDYANARPRDVRRLIREGRISGPTAGMCAPYVQANLVVLRDEYAYDFLLFTQRNPKACPLLEVSDLGSRSLSFLAADADLAVDLPKYRVYERGVLSGEHGDVAHLWRADFVSFLIGCSFSFEAELLAAGVPVRHIEEGRNVPMYRTSRACVPAGVFRGNLVVSMRPIPVELVVKAALITGSMPRVHGGPVHIGDPAALGIGDLDRPDFGEPVTVREGEVPVFWACGVTPQAAVMEAEPDIAITHAPGHMFIADIKNIDLKYD